MNTLGVKIRDSRTLPKDYAMARVSQIDMLRYFYSLDVRFFEIQASSITDSEEYKKYSQEVKFGLHLPHVYSKPSVCFCSTLPEEIKKAREWLKKGKEIAEKLNAEYIALHPDAIEINNKRYAETRKEGLVQLVKNIKSIKSKIPILIENMPSVDYLCYEASEMQDMRRKTGCKFLFDVEHAYSVSGDIDNVIKFYKKIEKNIIALHICDKSKKGGLGHLPLGKGDIDFKRFFSEIKTRDKYVCVEVVSELNNIYKSYQELIRLTRLC